MLANQEIDFISGLDTAHCDIRDEFEAYLPRAFPGSESHTAVND